MLVSDEPEIARTLAACVQQHIAFGERAGQQVRRMGSGFGYAGEHPVRTDTRCASINGFSLHAKDLQLFPGLITLVPHIYAVRQELEA